MLDLSIALPIRVQNGGLFISRGVGSHPARRLESWELIFVQQGTLTIRENDVLFEVKAGENLLLWPQRRHVGVGDFPPDLTFYWVHFDVLPATTDPTLLLSLPQHISVSSPQYVMSLFRQFLSEQENKRHGPALEFILLLILQQIASAVGSETHGDSAGVALAYKARKQIRTQYHLPLSTSQLARELHCNADYLGRVYRRIFHMTMTEAIHRQRVSAAEKLLISDSLALSEVSEKCGFNDVGYFRQIFRKHTGLTPAAWKRRYCKEHINSD